MTPGEQFQAWRGELAAELDAARSELATARDTCDVAEAAHRDVRSAWQALDGFAAAGMRSPSDGLAGPLHSRILGCRAALDAAEAERGAALGTVKGLEQRVKSLQEAIDQADRALTAAKITQLPRPAAEPSRRKPQPIEFDNIAMPRGAASS